MYSRQPFSALGSKGLRGLLATKPIKLSYGLTLTKTFLNPWNLT